MKGGKRTALLCHDVANKSTGAYAEIVSAFDISLIDLARTHAMQ